MTKPDIPVVITVGSSVSNTEISLDADEVILRARASNVQAISANLKIGTTSSTSDPTSNGANAFVLFPGESISLPTRITGQDPLQVKTIIFEEDTNLADPILEMIEIIP